jgi:ADP-heptose:LPS heptosyltransferase
VEKDTGLTRILVVELWNIGDVILTMPFLAQLRAIFPDAEISLLARPYAAEILAGTGLVDHFIEAELTWKRERHHNPFGYNWRELRRVVSDLRRESFDLAFQCRPHVREYVLLGLSGAQRRVGWRKRIWDRALTDPISSPEPGRQKKDAWLRLLQPFGGPRAIEQPHLLVTRSERDWAEDFLTGKGVASTSRLVAIHPGASIPEKRWPLAGFAEVARELGGRSGTKVLAFADQEGYGSSLNQIEGVVPVREGLRRMIALLDRCSLLICNDSGPMHIAAALGVSTVAVFGSGIDSRFAPLGNQNESVIATPDSGRIPEGAAPIPYEDVSRVSVPQVLEATDRALEKVRATGEGAGQARLLLNHGRR